MGSRDVPFPTNIYVVHNQDLIQVLVVQCITGEHAQGSKPSEALLLNTQRTAPSGLRLCHTLVRLAADDISINRGDSLCRETAYLSGGLRKPKPGVPPGPASMLPMLDSGCTLEMLRECCTWQIWKPTVACQACAHNDNIWHDTPFCPRIELMYCELRQSWPAMLLASAVA